MAAYLHVGEWNKWYPGCRDAVLNLAGIFPYPSLDGNAKSNRDGERKIDHNSWTVSTSCMPWCIVINVTWPAILWRGNIPIETFELNLVINRKVTSAVEVTMIKAVILIGGPMKGKLLLSVARHKNSSWLHTPTCMHAAYFQNCILTFLSFIVIGTRFRPLSLELPKPLFPIGGFPVVYHHIEACKKV